MGTFSYYNQLYKAFLKNTFSREADYRASFIGNLFDSIINFTITILLFDILYSKVNLISGWSKYETLFLVGYAQLITSFIFILFMNNLPRVQKYILTGDLDLVIVKPCDTQFYVSLRYFYFGGLSSLFPSLILLIYSSTKLQVDIDIINLCTFVALVLCSLAIAYSLWMILMTMAFYFIKVNQLHELFLSVLKFMEYPAGVYKGIVRFIFTFLIPVISIANIPVEFILDKGSISKVILLILIALIFICFSRLFWKISIKRYQSASS